MKNIYLIFTCLLISVIANAQNNTLKLNGIDLICSVVDDFSAINQTNNSVDVIWSPSPSAISHTVSYRLLSDSVTYAVSIAEDSLASIYALDSCSGYEFFITTVCADFEQLESVHDTFYTRCDTLDVGINLQIVKSQLLFYPNPTSGVISINLTEPVYGDLVLKIYNNMGIIQEQHIYVLNGESRLVNLDKLNVQTGTNYFTLWYNGKIETGQILVIR